MAEQKYTSAKTSINKIKLPAIYNKINFSPGSTVLDYGCGRYISHIQSKVNKQGCTYIPYDPYNLLGSKIPTEKVDYVICSNVLNVIDNIEVIKEIIFMLVNKAKHIAISIYEGDGSGIGKVTGEDTYQRNEKISDYVKLIQGMGYKAIVKNKVVYIINE